ncbi:MAG TPA: CYTH and CHAD domain-containing protein [Methylomusa anaerophila]|uniref:CHAD domain protein n=1 Tax=Methylomusa anaerophila TaxID=1930071 RepID=A0A348AJJ6_9FIRM|nr:CYTH and CHAD domain-containing protein [Methylomusa anaerophila]BBB91244.1 CHAD domain protein [Methylomusa anaerophila]HML89762.1 CYTH and CHAD domain-containing protein [Methylomusa anaerophila]
MPNIESELKLKITDPSCLPELLKSQLLQSLAQQPGRKETLDTTYYDTRNHSLLNSRLSYRLRRHEENWTATIKADGSSDGGLHQRTEFNAVVHDPQPNIEPFADTPIGPRLKELLAEEELAPIFGTRFDRYIFDLVAADGSEIELAIDDGEIVAGDSRQKLLELELKSGASLALIRLGAELAKHFPLLPEQHSKLYRAIQLAGIDDGFPKDPPAPLPLHKESAQAPVLSTLSLQIIHQIHLVIAAQHAFLADSADPETLHDLRISLRRLRVLLSFAKPLLPAEEITDWQTSLRQWSNSLGPVRDLDVLYETWLMLNNHLPNHPDPISQALTAAFTEKRTQLVAEIYNSVSRGYSTPLLLGLWVWTAEWPDRYSEQNNASLLLFIVGRLNNWLKQFVEAGSKVDLSDETAVHQLRIQGKKIRYAMEVFAPILPGRSANFTKRLKSLQDNLGLLRDTQSTIGQLNKLVKASSSRKLHNDSGLLLGWQLSHSLHAKAEFEEIWTKMKKSCRKWLAKHSDDS